MQNAVTDGQVWTSRTAIPRHAGPRVLVVDDNENAAHGLAAYLCLEDIETRIASSFEDALRQARRWNPDVVVLDIMMPGRDGFEIAKALREQLRPGLPIIAFTAADSVFVKTHHASRMFDGYCQKGSSPSRIFAVLNSLWGCARDSSTSQKTG